MQANYPFINPGVLSYGNSIVTYQRGYSVKANSSSISESSVRVDIAPLGSLIGIDEILETKIRLISVLLLSDPIDSNLPKFQLLSLKSDDRTLSLNGSLDFELVLSGNQCEKVQRYQQRKRYLHWSYQMKVVTLLIIRLLFTRRSTAKIKGGFRAAL